MLTQTTIPQLRDILRVTLSTDKQPVLILGSPGLAKTQFCRSEVPGIYASVIDVPADEVGYIEFNAGQRDHVEVSGLGLPRRTEAGRWETEFSRSPLLCMIEATGKQYGVLCIDEVTQCGQEMQKVLRPLFDADTRTMGGDPMPEGWIVIATGNRLADKSGSTRVLSHLANACLRFELKFDFDAWRDWAVSQDLHPMMIACVEAHHEVGLFVDSVPAEDIQFCTPRSFSRTAVHMSQMLLPDGTPRLDSLARKLTESAVGPGAAEVIFNWLEMFDKVPSAKDIQRDPENALLPEQTNLQYAASNVALGSAVDSETADMALRYLVRLRPDLQISTASALLRKSARQGWPVVGPTASQFIAKYAELLPLTVKQ